MKNQHGASLIFLGTLILILVIVAAAYYLASQNNKLDPEIKTSTIPAEFDREEEVSAEVNVKAEAGDIVVSKNGQNEKITDWGHNSSPTLSPDKTKVAYTSKTEQSIENAKSLEGYVPDSTNVWTINIDGSNPVKVTNHKNWVSRTNLLWLDNNRLLFTDGTSSVKIYNIADNTTKNVLGPEDPEGICVDACGGSSGFVSSPDRKYLVSLSSDSNGGIAVFPENQILNTQTLKVINIEQEFVEVDYSSAVFNKDTLSINASDKEGEPSKVFNISLLTGKTFHL